MNLPDLQLRSPPVRPSKAWKRPFLRAFFFFPFYSYLFFIAARVRLMCSNSPPPNSPPPARSHHETTPPFSFSAPTPSAEEHSNGQGTPTKPEGTALGNPQQKTSTATHTAEQTPRVQVWEKGPYPIARSRPWAVTTTRPRRTSLHSTGWQSFYRNVETLPVTGCEFLTDIKKPTLSQEADWYDPNSFAYYLFHPRPPDPSP